ncbi:MAG: fatty acid desaturase, partial [Bacteroidota bacterium]
GEQKLYLINRHPLTIIFGHLTLFIYWLNLKSFIQSPKKHMDSFAALFLHGASAVAILYFSGFETFVFAWWIPYSLAFGIGSYLFYSQHNFPSAQFRETHDWKYEAAALESTSFMEMHPLLHWMTGNIGYHHVHHLNSRIPFYRLPEAMKMMPELQDVATTSWNPMEIIRCFSVKLWDVKRNKMVTMKEAKVNELKPGLSLALQL